MVSAEAFRELMRRVRAGDAEAATQLVRQYEPAIRLAAHVRLTDPALRRLLDSQDICQSVMASFLVRAAAGQYEVDTPEQLVRLLTTMTRNKLVNQAEHHRAARRDVRRGAASGREIIDPDGDPSELVAHEELVAEFRRRLSPEERRLADARRRGLSWQEVADEFGGKPNGLRMRLERAIARVAQDLGLEI